MCLRFFRKLSEFRHGTFLKFCRTEWVKQTLRTLLSAGDRGGGWPRPSQGTAVRRTVSLSGPVAEMRGCRSHSSLDPRSTGTQCRWNEEDLMTVSKWTSESQMSWLDSLLRMVAHTPPSSAPAVFMLLICHDVVIMTSLCALSVVVTTVGVGQNIFFKINNILFDFFRIQT